MNPNLISAGAVSPAPACRTRINVSPWTSPNHKWVSSAVVLPGCIPNTSTYQSAVAFMSGATYVYWFSQIGLNAGAAFKFKRQCR